MTLLEELQRAVRPFYTAHDRNFKHWPRDTATERYCASCGWQPLSCFSRHGSKVSRECERCTAGRLL